MKHTLRWIAAVTAVAASTVALSSCADGGSPGADADDRVTIGVAMKTEVQARWGYEVKVMERVAEELGADVVVQWANDDATKQNNQIENLISQGVDAVIVVPVTDKAGPYLQSLKTDGIPVIAYDLLPEAADIDFFVTRDNHAVGVAQAEAALEYIGDAEANVAILKGDAANMVAQGIAKGYESLEAAPNVNVVTDQWIQAWSTEEALNIAENSLSANDDDITAFITGTDGLAMGAVQAVRGRGKEGEVFISGLDVEPANAQLIAEGVQTMSVWTDIEDQAEKAITAAIALARGEEPESQGTESNGGPDIPTAYADIVPIFQEDLCRFIHELSPEGWITEKEVFSTTQVPEGCSAVSEGE